MAERSGGGRCEQASGGGQALRGLSQAECVAYARLQRLDFLGVQSERSEFGGCVVWNARTVEFNDVSVEGCNVGKNSGECLCTPAGG